jgi:O-antigen ligase
VKGHPLGIGPGNSVLQAVPIGHRERPGMSFQAKEAHSDYVAYAIERGPIGLLGQVLWVLASLALVLGGAGVADPRRSAIVRAAMVGGLLASATHSVVIEKLHFRHYWLFLALACALAAGERFRPGEREP